MPAKTFALAGILLVAAMPAAARAKPVFVEAEGGPDPRGLTLHGSGLAPVERPARPSETTIERAVEAARPTAQSRALRDARRRALALADAAGLALGPVRAVTDRLPDTERYPAPSRYCYRARGNASSWGARVRCRVPALASASVRITFATRQTSAVAAGGRALVASGSAAAPVRPRRMTTPSIRAALARAQREADPLALAVASRRAGGAAKAAGFRLGPLFALAEEPRQPFFGDILSGTFGPGRFCGTIRRVRVRRDPVTGERQRVRGPRVRRCYVPPASSVLRMTFVGGG